MKMIDFCRKNIDCYSFHAFAWLFWIFLFIAIVGIVLIFNSTSDLYQTIIWHILFFGPTIYIPVLIEIILLSFLFLLEKEKTSPSFRIKNNKWLLNPIYKTFISVSYILEWCTVILLTLLCLYIICVNIQPALFIFIIVCCPILIVLGAIYILVSQKFLL